MKLFIAMILSAAAMFAEPPSIFSKMGKFLGKLSADRYDADSISNPYGRYGSRYSSDSIHNPYGQYGSRYSSESPWSGTTDYRPIVIGGSASTESLWPAPAPRRPWNSREYVIDVPPARLY